MTQEKRRPTKVVVFKRELPSAPEDSNDVEQGSHGAPLKYKSRAPTPLSPISQPSTPYTIPASPDNDCYAIRPSHSTDTQQTITLEHSVKTKGGGGTAKALTKPIVTVLGGLLLLSTGSAAYFFTGWLNIPGLDTQIGRLREQNALLEAQVNELETQVDRLESQVDRLSNETDRLANETDRLEIINDDLEINIQNLSQENQRLNASLIEFNILNTLLNATVIDLVEQNDILKESLQDLSGINQDLNQTVNTLEDQVDQLKGANDELLQLNDGLWLVVDQLSNETSELSELSAILNQTTIQLQSEVSTLTQEITRLSSLNIELATMVSFLNETAINIDESFEEFTKYLADQINGNRVLIMETLETLFLQRASYWDCDFREYFLVESFTQNRNAAIGEELYPEVMDYVQNRVLDDLCLSTSDFEAYLIGEEYVEAEVSEASFNDMLRAVGRYTDLAVDYYFPRQASDPGLTPRDWADASYNCINLPELLRYSYVKI